MIGMKGLLGAQLNLKLASKIQHSANMTAGDGRILERQGITDGNEKAIEKGRELQAKGEEIRTGVFEHLEKANKDIAAAAEEGKEAAKERREAINDRIEAARERKNTEVSKDEDNTENQIGILGFKPGGIDVIIDDEIRINQGEGH